MTPQNNGAATTITPEVIARIRNDIDALVSEEGDQVWPVVRAEISSVLDVDGRTIDRSMTLIGQLGATSLDFLDLMFRVEAALGVRIPRQFFEYHIRDGDKTPSTFGLLSDEELRRLKVLMPEAEQRITQGVRSDQIAELYTAETILRLAAFGIGERRRSGRDDGIHESHQRPGQP